MSERIYMSNISPYWTFERQEAVLGPRSPGATVFRDELDKKTRRGHSPAALVERGQMLRVTRRPDPEEVVRVASYAVLASSAGDFQDVLAALEQRGARLVSVDDGDVSDVLAAWHAARVKSRLAGASLRGGAVNKANIEAVYRPICEPFRERWGDPAYNAMDLAREAGVSMNTMVKYLGKRGAALDANAARLRRKAKKEAGSK
jgi:hypothetical protein